MPGSVPQNQGLRNPAHIMGYGLWCTLQSTLAITDDQNLEFFVRYSKGSGVRNIA